MQDVIDHLLRDIRSHRDEAERLEQLAHERDLETASLRVSVVVYAARVKDLEKAVAILRQAQAELLPDPVASKQPERIADIGSY